MVRRLRHKQAVPREEGRLERVPAVHREEPQRGSPLHRPRALLQVLLALLRLLSDAMLLVHLPLQIEHLAPLVFNLQLAAERLLPHRGDRLTDCPVDIRLARLRVPAHLIRGRKQLGRALACRAEPA